MSDADVLFTITTAHLDTGLRGYPVGYCRTSKVDPHQGVSYVGYPITELARREPIDIVHLMFKRELPTGEQREKLSADLKARRGIPAEVLTTLASLPKSGHPMAWLGTGLQLLGLHTRTGDWMEDALNLVARTPELVAAIFRLHSGLGEPIAPSKDLGLIEDFVHMLGIPGADKDKLAELLKVFYILHVDHGGGNLSTFTGKAVASGHADIFTAMSAAMGALSGPLHGGANQACLEQLREVGTSDVDKVEAYVRDRLANKQKVFGFGHGVLRAEDPRATIQYELGQELCPDDELFKTALAMRKAAVKVLSENPKISNPHPNVDAVSGSLLQAGGLEDSNYYTNLFGLARITGIAAQIVDERVNARNGRGVPIYRPKYVAKDQDR